MSDYGGVSAYPLAWPIGRKRTPARQRAPAKFRTGGRGIIAMTDARSRLSDEIDRLHAGNPVLSTNIQLRLDGQLRIGQAEPDDPGVALYFQLSSKSIVLACDRWDRVAGNMAAIAAHIDALRGQSRWGVGTVEEAFAGFAALPAPVDADQAWRSLLGNPVTLADAIAAYTAAIRKAHPDAGGSHAAAAALNDAMDRARKVLL